MAAHLSDLVKTVRVVNSTAAGTTDINSTGVDMTGFDAVRFVAVFGVVTNGTHKIKAQQSSDDGSSDTYADLAGSLTDTGVVAADDEDMLITDLIRPKERYVRCVVDRDASNNAEADAVIAELYRTRDVQVTHDSTVKEVAQPVHKREGTA